MSRQGISSIGRVAAGAAVAAWLVLPHAVTAQGGPGFRFNEPRATLKFEMGYGFQLADSEIFDMTFDSLTVGQRDFDAPQFGAEVAIRVDERWDVALGVAFSHQRVDSEFRNWVGTDDLPIEQSTELQLLPLSLTGKYYLKERGRRIGRFAWVPNRGFNPYVGAGLGVLSYRFEQFGEFVDFQTFDIFYDRFTSQGEALLLRAVGGAVMSLGGHFELSGEVRYSHASATMSRDFDGFDPLDLSGFQGVIGIGVRF